ncbi:MAG: acyl-CoA dehydrogenase family protein, partial [Dehalococcoidia bacterium]|nr:acyl-CoA dehydrogenase family protein [Dehalococcoidia bacterium]
ILKKSARDFLSNESALTLARQMETDEVGYPPQLWSKMTQLGWLGLIIPEEYGGGGGTFEDLCVLLGEMGRASSPAPFLVHSMGTLLVLHAGSDEQKRALLPAIAVGKSLIVPAFYESGFGQPDSPVRATTATARDGAFEIKGAKTFVPYAHVANFLALAARTGSGRADTTLFLVEAGAPGMSKKPLDIISGEKLFSVEFDGVRVARNSILGLEGKSSRYLSAVMEKGALMKCSEMVGAAERVLEITVEYAKTRVQFGQPIGKFQAIQHHCTNMYVDLETSRLITNRAVWMVNEEMPCAKEVSMAKAWVSEAYRRILVLAHQVNGGVGLIIDHDLPIYTERSFGKESEYGDADFHREVIAQKIGM